MVYNGYHPELSLQNPSQLGPPGPQNKRNGRNEKMKTWKRALALVLALVMALSLVALPSFAEGEEDSTGNDGMPYIEENGHGGTVTKDGLVMSKTIKKTGDSQFLLTLEAYATGSTTTTTTKDPVDIVLVLDVSGSMDDYMETYSVSPGGTYYRKDSDGDFQRVYYCSSCGGWFTREHEYIHYDTRLTPKTSASDTNTSHTQFYSDVTKMETLKSAVSTFIDNVAKESPDSNIAIVKFAGNKWDTVGNDTYEKGIYTYNYSQIVQNLTTVDETGASSLKTAVNGLIAAGTTLANYGMEHAQTIINGAKDKGRQKVVVMFTDGEPNGIEKVSGFEKEVANSAINTSKSIKDAGATVYTIGCFGSLDADKKANVDTYMNYVSSNYPKATSMTADPGAQAEEPNYYKTVSSAADLNNIFTDISHTIGGTDVKLTSTSVLRDVISDYFKLPEGADKNSITAYSVDCTAVNDDGTYTWSANRDTTPYSVTVEGKTIKVTDFDYAANWVGKDTTTGKMHTPAKKLVVEIPIVPEQDAIGSVKTNGDASGIYADSTVKDPVEKFPSPVVYIPYFTVTHVASTVDSATGANKGEVRASKNYPLWCHKEFNLTSVVTANHLYGGTFNEETCTTVHDKVKGQNPMAIAPVENETYYIWEVPDTYLRPFTFYVWQHVDGKKTVTKLYPLVGVDRTKYANVGFSVCWGTSYNKDNAVDIPSRCDELSTGAQAGTAEVYQYLLATKSGVPVESWYLKNGTATKYKGDITTTETIIDEGCIGGFRLDAQQFENFKSDGITYRPYWITLDGVRVDSVRSRTLTFQKGSETPIYNPSQTGKYSAGYTYVNPPTAQTLSFRTCMLADDSQPVVDERLTVTVVDGSNTTQVKVAPNGSVRDQVAYQAPAGKVFAGWFADQAYTTPADLDQVTEDTTIYAKYVSDSYLDLDYSRTGLFRLRGVTLISAVDNPANYQASGIMVNGQKLDVSYASRYRIFKTPANLFGAARDAKLMLADKSLSGTGTLEVTPYWITLDGTEVHGVTHTLHYNTRTIWE